MEDAETEKDVTPQKAEDEAPSTMIQINFVSNQVASIDTKSQAKSRMRSRISAATKQHLVDISDFRITTERVAQMLLKVLEQNDNSENYFDDSFLVRDILASLGRLDNMNYLHRIACEIHRQFRLDQISNSSPRFAITAGAIKGFFNLRKQIFRFLQRKQQYIDPKDPIASHRIRLENDNHHVLTGHLKDSKRSGVPTIDAD